MHAQQLPDVVRGLRPEQTIRVRTRGHAEHIGRFTRLHGDTLYLDPAGGSAPWVALDAVEGLWVRGTAAGTGALIGGIGGGVATAGLFAWVASAICDAPGGCGDTDDAAIIGGLLGAGAGALAGAVIGTFVDKWHRRYP